MGKKKLREYSVSYEIKGTTYKVVEAASAEEAAKLAMGSAAEWEAEWEFVGEPHVDESR